MTNEEAKAFLDNLKICINEHPIVADWLVEIADRKTEPQTDWETEKRDNSLCYKCVKECDRRVLNRYTIECNQYEPKDEPQTDVYEYHNGEWVKPDCPWK